MCGTDFRRKRGRYPEIRGAEGEELYLDQDLTASSGQRSPATCSLPVTDQDLQVYLAPLPYPA